MEQHRPLAPICTIKAKHLKCPRCHVKLKGMLQKLDGVEDTIIDPEQGLLKVAGKINPLVILKVVQEVIKSAELWSFQREPSQTNTKEFTFQIGKDCPCEGQDCDEVSSDDEPSSYIAPTKQHKKQKGILSWARKEKKSGNGFSGMSVPMPQPGGRPSMGLPPRMGIPTQRNFYGPPRPGYPPPRPYYQSYHGQSPPPYIYHGQMPPPYYRSMSPPKVNPMIHFQSPWDNYRYR